MGDVSRTITVKFTGQSKQLVTEVAKVDAALGTVGKQTSEIKRVSESMQTFSQNVTSVTKQTSKLTTFKEALRGFSDGVQPLGTAGLRLAAVTTAVVALAKVGPYLAPLVGLLGLLPGVVGVAAGAFAVLKLGSDGIAAAFKGVGDNAKKQVSDVFQRDLVPAVKAANTVLDKTTPALKGVAATMASVVNMVLRTAASATNIGRLNTVLGATKVAVGNIGAALYPLVTAFLTVAATAAPIFADLTSKAGDWADKLDAKVQKAAANGKLAAWIQAGIARFTDLKNAVVRIWKDIEPILKGLAGSRLTLFSGIGASLIEPALKAVGDFMSAHPDFAQWIVAGGLALKGFAVAMALVNAAMDINPIILAIEAIALLAVGLAALYQNNAGFKKWVDQIWAGIEQITGQFIGWWQQHAAPILAAGWDLVVAAAKAAYDEFNTVIVPGLKKLWADISPILQQAWQNLVDAWNQAKPTLMELYHWIKDHWSEIKQAAKDYGEAIAIVVGAVVLLLALLAGAVAVAIEYITASIKLGVQVFKDLKQAVQDFLDFFGRFSFNIGVEANQAGSSIKRALTDPWGAIQDAARGSLQWVKDAWSGLPSWFRDLASQIASPFVAAFNAIVGGVRGAINSAIDLANRGIGAVNGATGAIGIPSIPTIPHLALGGPVQAGRPYIVGDGGGPELFVPRQSGRVVGTKDTADLMNDSGFNGDIHIHADFGSGIEQVITIKNRQLRAAVRAGSTR